MKVLYIAPYRDGTGYSKSAIEHILSLDLTTDVVCRPVKMTNSYGETPEEIEALEAKDLNGITHVVQHNLPSEFVYKGGVENIGVFSYETSNFANSVWPQNLGLMDKVVVSSEAEKDAIEASCDKRTFDKSYIIKHPVDTYKFDKTYETMDFDLPSDCVKFYTISEFNRRKNIPALAAAFYAAFADTDNVALIVKTNKEEEARALLEDVKSRMKRFSEETLYPPIILITDYLPDDHISSLHQSCDVFVSGSHGEAICLPFVDAMGFGRPAIAPRHSSFLNYSYEKDLLVDSSESVVFAVMDAPDGLYTCDERWGNVSLIDLARKMRKAYLEIEELRETANYRREYVKTHFSREAAGQRWLDILEGKDAN